MLLRLLMATKVWIDRASGINIRHGINGRHLGVMNVQRPDDLAGII